MDSIGQALKKAREGKKRTVPEVARAMRASIRYVEAIEAGDFRVFPAPIYALGFIRLYAECVGEDVRPLENAFRDLEAAPSPADHQPLKRKRAPAPPLGGTKPAPRAEPAKKVHGPEAPETADRSPLGIPSGPRPAGPSKMRWLELENRWASLSAIRLPVETWKTLMAVTGMTLLVIVAAAVLGWYLLSRNGAAPAVSAAQWLADPPAPYLSAE